MKLSAAKDGQVVRNVNNGSHYRYERMERGKVRIFPLELFPNGLLIAKPTPTLVELDLPVILVGDWTEDMVVEGKPTSSRRVYENELVARERELVELQVAYDALPPSGKGKQSRGSWANKVKNCQARIVTLKRGLGFVDSALLVTAPEEVLAATFEVDDRVQVPSGRIAVVMGFLKMGDQAYVQCKTMMSGAAVEAALPYEVLRPATEARLCSV